MKYGLDTSVVLRLLVGIPEEQAGAARAFLNECQESGSGPVQVSDLVMSEAFFALLHHYSVPAAEALNALKLMLKDPRIGATQAAVEVLETPGLAALKPGFVDRLIQAGYHQTGAGLITFDQSTGRLPGAGVLRRVAPKQKSS